MSDLDEWLSVAGSASQQLTIIDDVFTGKELRLVPGEVKALVEFPEEDPNDLPPTTGDPPKPPPVWRPQPLPFGEGIEMVLDLSKPGPPSLDARSLRALRSGRALTLHVRGSDLRLGQIEDVLRTAHETPGHLHIDFDDYA